MSLDQLPDLRNFYVLARKEETEPYVFVIDSGNPILHLQGPPPMSRDEAEAAANFLKREGYKQTMILQYESRGPNAYVNLSTLKASKVVDLLLPTFVAAAKLGMNDKE